MSEELRRLQAAVEAAAGKLETAREELEACPVSITLKHSDLEEVIDFLQLGEMRHPAVERPFLQRVANLLRQQLNEALGLCETPEGEERRTNKEGAR